MKKLLLLGLMVFTLFSLQGCGEEEAPPMSLIPVTKVYYKENLLYIVTATDEYQFDYDTDTLAFRGKTAKVLVADNKIMLQLPANDKDTFMVTYNDQKQKARE